MEFNHVPVMLKECIEALKLKDNAIYVDGTIGGGGHSFEILRRTKDSKLIGIDQDKEALEFVKRRLERFQDRLILVHSNFSNLRDILDKLGIEQIDGILLDLGVSSYQIDTPERGFSYRFDSRLDMRMDQDNKLSAYEVVNHYSEHDLARIINDYGEERLANKIAKQIVVERAIKPIETTFELKRIITKCIPAFRGNYGLDNVQRVFQAIRIEVNGELNVIEKTIIDATDKLRVGGRMAIITFHSLEDRIVKQTFKKLSLNCICPPEIPVCVCGGNNARLKLITTKPIIATPDELRQNMRASSAKLRIVEKIK